VALLSRAFRILALAAALDALIAISLRLLAPSFLARASPPSLASSERTFLINASHKLYVILGSDTSCDYLAHDHLANSEDSDTTDV
jgi:hypothetical protein